MGDLTGTQLELLPVSMVAWGDFAARYPDALVLSRDTGVSRDYGRNPYPGYDRVDSSPFAFRGEVDGRLAAEGFGDHARRAQTSNERLRLGGQKRRLGKHDVGEGLGEDAAEAKQHAGTELAIPNQARE